MKTLIAFLLLAFAVSADAQAPGVSAHGQPDGSVIIILTPEAVKHCASNNGCRIMTVNELKAWGDALITEERKKRCI